MVLDRREAIEEASGALVVYDTPLHVAVILKQADTVACLLQGSPLTVNKKNGAGETALHCAASGGRVDIISQLVNTNADLNAQNSDGKTPLHLAVEKSRTHAVYFLLPKTTQLMRDKGGMTPLAVAVLQGAYGVVESFLKVFPEALCTINTQRQSPLHLAAANGDLRMLKLLLSHAGFYNPLHLQDISGHSALHKAVVKGAVTAVTYLLNVGIDATLKDEDGETALHLACLKGHKNIIEILLRHNANLFIIGNNHGEMPLHYITVEHAALMQWLMVNHLGPRALMGKPTTESLVDTSIFEAQELTEGKGGISNLAALAPLLWSNALTTALMHRYTIVEAAAFLECLEQQGWSYSAAYTAVLQRESLPKDVKDVMDDMLQKIMSFYNTYVFGTQYASAWGNVDGKMAVKEALRTFDVALFFKEQLRFFPKYQPEPFMHQIASGESPLVRQLGKIFKDNLSLEPWFKVLKPLEKSTVRRGLNIPIEDAMIVARTSPIQQFSSAPSDTAVAVEVNRVANITVFDCK